MSAYEFNVAQKGDALALLRSLPDSCTPLCARRRHRVLDRSPARR
jgi:hypothetical protein